MEQKTQASKIVVLGEARVGKTSLTVRFCMGQFDDNQKSTLDASCLENTVNLPNGQQMRLTIWDTAGQERYHALNPVYYRGAEGALIVYDITDMDSFTKVNTWIKELRKYLPYARGVGSEHISTSAKTGAGVIELFSNLSKKIISAQSNKKEEAPKKKMNTRGVLKVNGYADFDPQMNVQLQSNRTSTKAKKKDKDGKKCC
ncbi:UNKNOWN [Stylonychia lemnae]|uniref:Uncharacterized protein n=1 Tax=Stylonychia lemnae TaxID=5949 RepID=A0A078AGK8_STYLE|nr:UNKNOWN [Stylonychia lemnae]|eukprot:CDW81410.1 UNKNOWN [Stylonychia lemnae]